MQKTIIIGILGVVDDEIVTRIQNTYIKAIEKFGGSPILLPYVERDESIDAFVSLCDGFLFTGGADIAPERYGETPKPTCGKVQKYRDELDFKAFYKAMKADKPILAICRGMQLVNAALGGTLYQDIPTEYETNMLHRQTEAVNEPSHAVNVITDTPLSAIAEGKTMIANSFHHQAIKDLAEGLAVTCEAEDGLIEGVYWTGDQYFRGYQWHPERLSANYLSNENVFAEFITFASKSKR